MHVLVDEQLVVVEVVEDESEVVDGRGEDAALQLPTGTFRSMRLGGFNIESIVNAVERLVSWQEMLCASSSLSSCFSGGLWLFDDGNVASEICVGRLRSIKWRVGSFSKSLTPESFRFSELFVR